MAELSSDFKLYQPVIGNNTCYHCGAKTSASGLIQFDGKGFCCAGCKTVYELLYSQDMCTYYNFQTNPGISPPESGISSRFLYLDQKEITDQLLLFNNGQQAKIRLDIPAMHCASCVWLLEALYRLDNGVYQSRVDFLKKQLTITFDPRLTSLRKLVELLTAIGYEPELNLEKLDNKVSQFSNRQLYIKTGVAGFAFANIMMFSFPEYLAMTDTVEDYIQQFFGLLSIALALPVLFYCSADYFRSAWQGWRQRTVNMDVPIAFGIISLFIRSTVEIVSGAGNGYMDSFAGLIFFLLIGKLFEKKTYDSLNFDRNYKSYFPIAVHVIRNNHETQVSLDNLQVGDRVHLRNNEVLPADAVLISGNGLIDYSFVTGESQPVHRKSGDVLYAGGRQTAGLLEVEVIKPVSQSYLTGLWNEDVSFKEHSGSLSVLSNTVSRYFTLVVLSLAIGSAVYWWLVSSDLAINAFSAVLIVACPCALALSTPFTLGNILRILSFNKFYLKKAEVIETLASASVVVFDKTGTITRKSSDRIRFCAADGQPLKLSRAQKKMFAALTRHSGHPLSQQVFRFLEEEELVWLNNFREEPGAGISALIGEHEVKLGSAAFTGAGSSEFFPFPRVYAAIDGSPLGYFEIQSQDRPGLDMILPALRQKYDLLMLTGDRSTEAEKYAALFGSDRSVSAEQTPFDKLDNIRRLQKNGATVIMVGDGLNDAGALAQSDVGISITDDINTFTPASDVIMDGGVFHRLPGFLKLARFSRIIILVSFLISFLYNIVGLAFAMSGTLSPLIAAVLMPLSSVSVVVFTSAATYLSARRIGLSLPFGRVGGEERN